MDLSEKDLSDLVSELTAFTNTHTDEIALHFVSKSAISALHEKTFNDPSPTDCITFPLDPPGSEETYHMLGEAFICPEVAMEYAAENGKDPFHELSLYVIHCFLHLVGYEDKTEKGIAKMRELESLAQEHLKKRGLLLKHPISMA